MDDQTSAAIMRRFELHRDEDVSGVSGTGVVAEGVAFSNDGPVALRWTSEWPTSVVFHDRGVESLEAVHGHNGRTRIVWLDREGEPWSHVPTVMFEDAVRSRQRHQEQNAYLRSAIADALEEMERGRQYDAEATLRRVLEDGREVQS